MVTLHHDAVNGLPTWWVDSGRPTLAASLIFRAGIADETLPTTGWLHLVEHLALHDRQSGALHVNGSVSLLTTQFDLHGPPAAVWQTIDDICGWLRDPDLGHLATESRVLGAESEFRGASDPAIALLQRYGARGAGLAGYAELGLARADPDGIRDLISRVFTSGNAALVLDGPPPSSLSTALPDGQMRPLPSATAVIDDRAGAYFINGPRMVVSGEVERSPAATFLPAILKDLFRRDLREGAGGAYAPWGSYEAVSHDTAVVFAGSDVSGDLRQSIVAHTLNALARLGSGDTVADSLADLQASALQALNDPHQASALAWRAGHAHLRGDEPQHFGEIIDEVRGVTSAAVLDVADAWRATLLLGVPGDARWNQELPVLEMPKRAEPAGGETYRSANFPASREKLRITSDVLAVGEGSTWASIDVAAAAGLMKVPDGGRRLIADDGWGLTVEPALWRRGRDAVAHLDAVVPRELHIPVDDRPVEQRPQPLPVGKRWLALLGTTTGLVAMGVICLALGFLAAIATAHIAPGILLGVPGFVFLRQARDSRAERDR